MSRKTCLFILGALCPLLLPTYTWAQEVSYGTNYSDTLSGPLGLNIVPNARMDPAGTVKLGISNADLYWQSYIGFQIADPLYINLRQSAEGGSLKTDPDRFYPGLDFKLRLLTETRSRPEVSIGVSSATGHKRMSGEYIAASKRYKDFDFTAGIGWGRFGSAGHLSNPLKALGDHFNDERPLDGERPSDISNWFTGKDVGFFGGIEYFTPMDSLSLKADYGADSFAAEQAGGKSKPKPWSIGASFNFNAWSNLNLALQGTDTLIGRFTLKSNIKKWRDQTARAKIKTPMRPYRTGLALPSEMALSAARDQIVLFDTETSARTASTKLRLQDNQPTPLQIGQAAVHMANHAGPDIEKLEITPTYLGLHGPTISLMRKDLEAAVTRQEGSAEEIWNGAEINSHKNKIFSRARPPIESIGQSLRDIKFTLDSQTSFAEEDHGGLYRTSLLAKTRTPKLFGLLDNSFGLRLNLFDNLENLTNFRPRVPLPVRSDIDQFAEKRLILEEAYTAFTHSFKPELHLSLMSGYLEEQYAGMGGELLWRPYNARLALGGEGWLALKRDPNANLAMGLSGDHLLSAHVNAWYDSPFYDLTFHAKAGRYLAEDIGLTLGLQKTFKNGATLEAYSTISDQADFDLFGDVTHSDHGIRLSLPLGGFKRLQNMSVNTSFTPFARDIGQSIKNPMPLYELTEPFSSGHIIRQWDHITPPYTNSPKTSVGPDPKPVPISTEKEENEIKTPAQP